jgi:hypothetical protein
MAYDPQRSRHRPEPTTDEPAPVDALLDAAPVATSASAALPEGVELEVTGGGEVVVHTADADVEITPSGDDVVVRTDDALVEVRAEADEVLVRAGSEDVVIDTTPWDDGALDAVLDAEVDGARRAQRTRLVVITLLAAIVAAVLASRLRRRRSGQ